MNESISRIVRLYRAAGYDVGEHPPDERQLREAHRLLERAAADPAAAVVEVLRAQRQVDEARGQCEKAAAAAEQMEAALTELLESDSLLCRLERLATGGPAPRAVCRIGGQLREVGIHPEAPLDRLERLAPWEYVRVNPREMIVVGVYSEPDLVWRAMGEVVELLGYHDRKQGLVRVVREAGHQEEIVTLAGDLRERPLSRPARLILHREDPRWAIALAPPDRPESKFETPLEQIQTRLEDLAGMEEIIERIAEDVLLRLIHTEIREEFDLQPLRGVLLYSYKPGMGKTALMRALAVWLHELGQQWNFDVVLYVVKPNELKIVWHGGDAKLVREELCGSILARQKIPRDRPLFQLVILDEIDSLGRRVGGDDSSPVLSGAQNDAVQSLLAEMDGMIQQQPARGDQPPAEVLWAGLTNRPDMVDSALKRPGRFGDLVLESPDITIEGAEGIMAVYARAPQIRWRWNGDVRTGVSPGELRSRLFRPALERIYPEVVLKCSTEQQQTIEVTAGQIMAGVHYKDAVNSAKHRAATRRLYDVGVAAVGFEDVLAGLLDEAYGQAKSMAADRDMLVRQLRLKTPIVRVDLVPRDQLAAHRYLRNSTA